MFKTTSAKEFFAITYVIAYAKTMKNNQNKNGFTVIELILMIMIICVVAAVGYLVYNHHHKANTSVNAPKGWLPYNNSSEKFSIYFPKHPQVVPLGNATQIQSIPNANSIYTVAVVNYPDNTAPNGKEGLSNILPVSEADYQNGKLTLSNYADTNGTESENFTVTGQDKGSNVYVFGEIIRTNQKVYNVFASFKGNLTNSQLYSKDFVNSFKLD